MEIHLFVAMVIYKYDMKLMGPVPEVVSELIYPRVVKYLITHK